MNGLTLHELIVIFQIAVMTVLPIFLFAVIIWYLAAILKRMKNKQ